MPFDVIGKFSFIALQKLALICGNTLYYTVSKYSRFHHKGEYQPRMYICICIGRYSKSRYLCEISCWRICAVHVYVHTYIYIYVPIVVPIPTYVCIGELAHFMFRFKARISICERFEYNSISTLNAFLEFFKFTTQLFT